MYESHSACVCAHVYLYSSSVIYYILCVYISLYIVDILDYIHSMYAEILDIRFILHFMLYIAHYTLYVMHTLTTICLTRTANDICNNTYIYKVLCCFIRYIGVLIIYTTHHIIVHVCCVTCCMVYKSILRLGCGSVGQVMALSFSEYPAPVVDNNGFQFF